MSISLPRVNSQELLLFPETAEGHVSKVLSVKFAGKFCTHGCLHKSLFLNPVKADQYNYNHHTNKNQNVYLVFLIVRR